MSNANVLINAEQIAQFVEENLTKPAAEIASICALIASSSEMAKTSFASAFSGNIHIGLSDIEKFNPASVLSNEPRHDIIRKLHQKVWYAVEKLIKANYTASTANYFSENILGNHQRCKALGCPNAENITKILVELADIQEASLELEALKTELNEMAEGDHNSKYKIKGGTFEQKAMLVAKLCNLRNRITNIMQPVHFQKEIVPSVAVTYAKILDLKQNAVGVEREIEYKCQVKIFNNGNIDLKLNTAYAEVAFNLALN